MKNKKKRILSIAIALCMLLTLVIPQTVMAQTEDVTILYTNDIHTYIDNDTDEEAGWNYAKLSALKDGLGENTLLVDCGDHIQGTAYGSMDEGDTIIDLMKSAGYDLATMGNHEFDYGMLKALEITENGSFPYVSCNFYEENDGVRGDNVLESYVIFERGGMKVAFIGITTPETFTKSTPAYFQDENGNYIYGISGGTDGQALYDDVQKAIDGARAEGADVVIALGHLGVDLSSAPWRSTDVIANTTGLDAFIDGHSHTVIENQIVSDGSGKEVVLTQTGSYFDAVGQMTISADGAISTELLTESGVDADGNPVAGFEERVEDAETAAIEDAWIEELTAELGQVIGRAEVVFDNYDENGNRLVRRQETNTGDFAADALYYLFDDMDLDVDVAVMNGGGIRNGAITGDLTYLSCKDIHTFGNVACLQTVTGQQILDALEWGVKDYRADMPESESGGFLHVSGLTYEINPYIESTVQADDKGVWVGGPTGEYRVRNVMIYDKESKSYQPLDLDAAYNLAGYNYTLRDLGDGFAMFDGAVNVIDYVMEDYMVLANYIESFPVDEERGLPVITADNSPYENVYGEGRIVAKCSHDVAKAELVGAVAATDEEAGYSGDVTCPTCGQIIEKGVVIEALGADDAAEDMQTGVKDDITASGGEKEESEMTGTGDASQAELWILAMIAAAGIAGGAAAAKQRRRSEEE